MSGSLWLNKKKKEVYSGVSTKQLIEDDFLLGIVFSLHFLQKLDIRNKKGIIQGSNGTRSLLPKTKRYGIVC
jgi:hypothetical protein